VHERAARPGAGGKKFSLAALRELLALKLYF
jgi:hypothetical protein